MPDFDRIAQVKKDAQARLRAIPGVHAVGIGPKIVSGELTSETAIIVYLVKKKASGEILPDEVIPPEIDGVKTDVVEMPVPRLHETAEGGLTISAAGSDGEGTLGCIMISSDQKQVYALTCHHVVDPGEPKKARLTFTEARHATDHGAKYTFSGTVIAGTLVYIHFSDSTGLPPIGAFYKVTDEDTFDSIGAGLAAEIATLASASFAVAATPGPHSVDVTAPGQYTTTCNVRGPIEFPSSTLKTSITAQEITFSGKVSTDEGGVYANVNIGGVYPSYGVFMPVTTADSLDDVAGLVAAGINAMNISGITAGATGPTITITPLIHDLEQRAFYIECEPVDDSRVGQPCLCSWCSSCCGPRIGLVSGARLDVDAALIKLDGGLKYLGEIDGINGALTGSYAVQQAELPYKVKKSGITTGYTEGNIQALNLNGYISYHDHSFHREYNNMMLIKSTNTKPFSLPGDSGSAILNSANAVVGLLFGGSDGDVYTFATPFQLITKAFSDMKFDIDVATSTTVQNVPANALVATPHAAAAPAIRMPGPIGAPLIQRMRDAQQELTATPAGQEYASVIRRHAPEVQTLINTNRRVATVWQRSGGPQMIQAMIGILQARGQTIPKEIEGKPLEDCVTRIQKVLLRYASPSLAEGLRQYAPRIATLGGLTYQELLMTLQAAPAR